MAFSLKRWRNKHRSLELCTHGEVITLHLNSVTLALTKNIAHEEIHKVNISCGFHVYSPDWVARACGLTAASSRDIWVGISVHSSGGHGVTVGTALPGPVATGHIAQPRVGA